MTNLGLFFAAVLIWGSTWLAIKFQLGSVSATVSVAWRFAIAAALLLAYSMWRGHSLRFARRDHLWMALQGVLLFGLNYIGVYLAEQYLTSGLVAVVFSLVVFFNIFGMRLFFGAPIRSAALLAALIAVSGVTLVFLPELLRFSNSRTQLQGLGFALGATAVASLGNMTAVRNQHHQLPVIQVNAWSMLVWRRIRRAGRPRHRPALQLSSSPGPMYCRSPTSRYSARRLPSGPISRS